MKGLHLILIKDSKIHDRLDSSKQGCQVWGGMGGTLPHPGVVPPHEDLSPPIPKILSPPPRSEIFGAIRA